MQLEDAEKALKDLVAQRELFPRRVIAVDVDGTLAQYKHWEGYTVIGFPNESVVDEVRKEHAAGTHVIIHTCRVIALDGQVIPEAVEALRRWLANCSIPYHEIWLGTGKPYANEYWDDKAVRKP
jgi:hypothetical protein